MNLSILLDMAAEGFADRIIVGSRRSGLTAADLRRLAVGGAEIIKASQADAVVYLGVNGPAFPVALFAAALAGVPLVPLNYRLGDEQLIPLLRRHAGALVLVGADQDERVAAQGMTPVAMSDWLARAGQPAGDGTPAPDAAGPAVVIYTSGTTSTPKGVLIGHDHLLSYVFGSVDFAAADDSDAALISVPPYHIAAVANAVTNVYAGRRTVVLEQFVPAEWLETVRREQITNALVVPTMLARIVNERAASTHIPSLRTLAYGGAPMPEHVVRSALQLWPDVDFVNAYGLTETSSTISVLGPEDHREALASEDPKVRGRLSSVGRVLPTIEVSIRDELGTPVPPDTVGRIWVRGAQVSAEYAGAGRNVDPDGWFDTRDFGRLDADGYLFVGGRADDTIIRGAENIAPAEIEEVLLAHAAVEDAVVVGIPDEEWGQRIEAAVVLRAPASADDLRDHVRAHLRSSKTPARIEIWKELPRTDTGKIVRRDVVTRLTFERT